MVRSTNDTPYDFLQIAGDELVSLAFELKVRRFNFFTITLTLGVVLSLCSNPNQA